MGRTFSIDEISELLGVSGETVRAWIARGELVAVNVSLNRSSRKPRYRIRESDLSVFLEGRATWQQKPQRRSKSPVGRIPQYV